MRAGAGFLAISQPVAGSRTRPVHRRRQSSFDYGGSGIGVEVGPAPRLVGRTRNVLPMEKPEPDRRKQGPRRPVCLSGARAHRGNGGVHRVTGTPPSRRSGRHVYPEHAACALFANASVGECRLRLLHGAPCSRCLRSSRRHSSGKAAITWVTSSRTSAISV